MILIVAARDLEPQILATLRDEFAMTRQNTRELLFDRDPNEVLKFKYNLRNSYLDITRLVYLNTAVGPQELDRIKAVADFAAQAARIGLVAYLSFLAFVSISLGVLNLLPIPVLDGGHLLYYAVEVVKGSPPSLRTVELAQRVGIGMLVLLTALALYNDLTRLLS